MIVMWYCKEINLGCSSNRLQLYKIYDLFEADTNSHTISIPDLWKTEDPQPVAGFFGVSQEQLVV